MIYQPIGASLSLLGRMALFSLKVTMQNALFHNPGTSSTGCTLLSTQGNNAKVLRPIAQLARALEAGRNQHGFCDAQATRGLGEEVTVIFESGLTADIVIRTVNFDLHIGRPPRLVLTSAGNTPSMISVIATPEILNEWIKITDGAGCIYCSTDNAQACELCSSTQKTTSAATAEVK